VAPAEDRDESVSLMVPTTLLTPDEVRARLHITLRQWRRLRQGPDPVPVVALSKKLQRIDPRALDAWLARRALAGGVQNGYHHAHDRQGTSTAAALGGPHPTDPGAGPGHEHELRRALGARRGGRPRGG
jgi:hypothetical protein